MVALAAGADGGPNGPRDPGHWALGRGRYDRSMSGHAERSSVLFDLFAASQRVRSLLGAAMAGCGLRADEYAVYSALFEFEPLSPTEIAQVVGMPPTTMSHYVREMRERGHLREEPNPRDGRSRMLRLSDAGRAAHRTANRAFEEAYTRFVAQLGDPAAVKHTLGEIEAAAGAALEELERDARARAG